MLSRSACLRADGSSLVWLSSLLNWYGAVFPQTAYPLIDGAQIVGIIICGSSMDAEIEATRKLGCWDAETRLRPLIHALEEPQSEDDGSKDAVEFRSCVVSERITRKVTSIYG